MFLFYKKFKKKKKKKKKKTDLCLPLSQKFEKTFVCESKY